MTGGSERATKADATNGAAVTAHTLLTPLLRTLVMEAEAARVRVGRLTPRSLAEDPEALHDLRVALRRLRTVLRPVRDVYGRKRLRAIADDLKRVADATGELRDEEVLRETLAGLELDPKARAELDRWSGGRMRREHARRMSVVRMLAPKTHAAAAKGESYAELLEQSLARLKRRFDRARRDAISIHELRHAAIHRCRADIATRANADPTDAYAMHALRIRYKRLRYTAELFASCAAESERADLERLAKRATKLQKRLGELHDLDEAIARVKRAWGLETNARNAVLAALVEKRARSATRSMAEVVTDLAASASSEAE